jgi:hypothetical protein
MSKKIFGRDNSGIELDLSMLNINSKTNDSKKMYEDIAENKELLALNLSINDFGYGKENDTRNLSNFLIKNDTLREINLSSCHFTSTGIEFLSNSLGVPSHARIRLNNVEGLVQTLKWTVIGTASSAVMLFGAQYYNFPLSFAAYHSIIFSSPLYATYQAMTKNILISSNNNYHNKSLKILDLSNNNIGKNYIKELAKIIKYNKSLTKLNLSKNNIDDQGAEDLSKALKENETLKVLDLSENYIKEVAKIIKYNKTLTKLDLRMNCVGDSEAKELSNAFKDNKTLKILNLSKNKISGESSSELICNIFDKNTTLKVLDLQGNVKNLLNESIFKSYLKSPQQPFLLKYSFEESFSGYVDIICSSTTWQVKINQEFNAMRKQIENIYWQVTVAPIIKFLKNELHKSEPSLSANEVYYLRLFQKFSDANYIPYLQLEKSIIEQKSELKKLGMVIIDSHTPDKLIMESCNNKEIKNFINNNYFYLTGIKKYTHNSITNNKKDGDIGKLSRDVLSEICSYLKLEDVSYFEPFVEPLGISDIIE